MLEGGGEGVNPLTKTPKGFGGAGVSICQKSKKNPVLRGDG